ncbi:MAG: M1 family metallopeptidase [Ferruginibacter sp.]
MAVLKSFTICFAAFILLALQPAAQQPAYWQQQVNYTIDVVLHDTDHTVDGFIKMLYTNNSPDTLHYIWIHVWPNAFKNDRTAFTDQQLGNGQTAFYFSGNKERGYINRLNFRVNNVTATMEDHPQHQDIIRLILPAPLPPKSSCSIETPFHVKLPYNFSRGGHLVQAYQLTQWYPKPAVYDHKGWHPMPYLDEGEFYSEFGNYDVQITVPENYVVAATGNLQENSEKQWLQKRAHFFSEDQKKKKTGNKIIIDPIPSATKTKTLHYVQQNVHDFAWFADKAFRVKSGKIQLPSGRSIDAYAFYYAENENTWSRSMEFIKQAILTKSKWLGEYPYDVVSVVEDERNDGGMEYPTITFLSSGGNEKMLDFVINHEVGHNWFYGILASNERQHPWMDEGMNTYYDYRYMKEYYGLNGLDFINSKSSFIKHRMPEDIQVTMLQSAIAAKKDQPVETVSEQFNSYNYGVVAYTKTGKWMQLLEKQLGREMFDSCMRNYYRHWSFRHPYPEDFKKLVALSSHANTDSLFSLLHTKGSMEAPVKKDFRVVPFFSLKDADKHHYIFISPAVGFNFYDKVMPGILLHNYTIPQSKFQFALAPLYSSKSKKINGIGKLSYSWFPGNNGARAELALTAARFSADTYTDSTNHVNYLGFTKLAPSFKYVFANKNSRSTITKSIQWKTYLISEQQLQFDRDTALQIDIISYPSRSRYINQLQFTIENERVLYPYKAVLMAEQSEGFVRTSFTGHYFFNYPKAGGLQLRFFAGKFFYTGDKTTLRQLESERYHLNMTGPRGYEDYTYSNYFTGRNEFDKIQAQQLMIRDGGFKIGTDLLFDKVGKTDNWLTAVNLTSSIPDNINPLKVLPVKIPLKLFLDIGSSAATWKRDAGTGRFVYDAGLQLSIAKGIINIYLPLLYSKVYRDYFTSYITEKKLMKKIAFSIDFSSKPLKKILPFSGL